MTSDSDKGRDEHPTMPSGDAPSSSPTAPGEAAAVNAPAPVNDPYLPGAIGDTAGSDAPDGESAGREPADAEYRDAFYEDESYQDAAYPADFDDADYPAGFDDAADPDDPADPDPADEAPVAAHHGPRHPLRLVLTAVLVGAVVAAGVLLWRDAYTDHGSVGSTTIGDSNAVAENDFTRSEAGDCLQWDAGSPGEPRLVECAEPHRFEVAGRLDTASFPTSEFAASAPWPGPERFAAIRDENCPTIVRGYLGGGLDPQGRFAPGLMFPSKVQWEKGARVLRCGIEQPGAKGVQEEFAGRVADIDQSFTWPIGTCVGIDKATRQLTGEVVSCAEPHAFQTTGVVDLSQRFGVTDSGKPWPSVQTQNDYLRTICPTQTNKFLGGDAKFRATTLNVQWSVISEVSWLTGSRRVVCYIGLPDRGGFATLVGDARENLLVNGKVPVAPKEGPAGRSVGAPVPLPPGYTPNDSELPAPAGG